MLKKVKLISSILLFALLMIPAGSNASTLDDYYLERFDSLHARHLQEPVPLVTNVEAPEHCLTPLYHSLQQDWHKLLPATRDLLAQYLAKPSLSGEKVYPSPGGHFSFHYATTGSDAPDLTDNNGNNVPDWIEQVADTFENVYRVEVVQMGYKAAQTQPTSPYDIYLQSLAGIHAYGYTQPDTPGTPTFIVIDKSFTDPIYAPANGIQGVQVTAAHEYHHAIQFTYTFYFESWYGEANRRLFLW